MTKFTPGPWFVSKDMLTAINNGPSDKPYKHIAMVNFYNATNPIERVIGEEHEANARLIAAAPECLQALEQLTDYLKSNDLVDCVCDNGDRSVGLSPTVCEYHQALEVIAKAKGEA